MLLAMLLGKKLIVIMPAYNAENTLRQTYDDLPHEYVDEVILVDDASNDNTQQIAGKLGIKTIIHQKNRGYGANQKTCYREALRCGADIVVMVHPDYQYSPRLVTAMAAMLASGHYDVVLGSRILGGTALKGGMPLYKYVGNRFLTLVENMALGVKLSEYHTGFRAFTRQVLETLPLEENSDNFVFDSEMLVQTVYFGFRVGELSCPTRYFKEASSINFRGSVKYGFGVVASIMKYLITKVGVRRFTIFSKEGKKISYN
jgi:glycosyltransferase involved in cell wall biosynthesis